jgi:hypothetical protein
MNLVQAGLGRLCRKGPLAAADALQDADVM